jgi:hypothetical protein
MTRYVNRARRPQGVRRSGWLILAWLLAAVPLQAGDLKLQAQLIWGTNEEKPAGKDLKEIDLVLQKKLRSIFKWKNYFEVNRQFIVVADPGTGKARLSDKCVIEVEHFGNQDVEVKLFGQGKLVGRLRETLSKTKSIVLAGDDKRDTAWFVVVTLPED